MLALITGGADINSVSIGVSPLHLAIQYERTEVVKTLIKAGANVNVQSAIDGSTPLYYAAGHGLTQLAKLLLAAGASYPHITVYL